MKLSEIYKSVLRVIEKDQENHTTVRYICFEINYLNHISTYARHRAKDVITTRLGKHTFLDDWMENEIGKEAILQAKNDGIYRRKMMEARIAWLKSLITEFESIGD